MYAIVDGSVNFGSQSGKYTIDVRECVEASLYWCYGTGWTTSQRNGIRTTGIPRDARYV